MKAFKILPVLLSILFTACGDNNNEDIPDFVLNAESLKQTVWQGSYTIYSKGEETYRCAVKLFFKTETEVEFTETEDDGSYKKHTVPYQANTKMLSIEMNGISPLLSGNWLLVENKGDRLVLKKNLGDESDNYTMTLSKIFPL